MKHISWTSLLLLTLAGVQPVEAGTTVFRNDRGEKVQSVPTKQRRKADAERSKSVLRADRKAEPAPVPAGKPYPHAPVSDRLLIEK